jgi:hypothetical protein
MIIELKSISIRELTKDYLDRGNEGVSGYNGLLDIRPPYQREFIYDDKKRNAVINTITLGYPLNVMYWAVREDGGFEIIDGQQRTISICQYVNGDFSIDGKYIHSLQSDELNKILEYELMVYQCTGTPSEKLEWFRIINISGEKLTEQELRNAVYHGIWTTDAKKYFSKRGCVGYTIGKNYLKGDYLRQDYLETIIKWISNNNIKEYMSRNQHNKDAGELWLYFKKVIDWVELLFTQYRREMKGIEWGFLYNSFSNQPLRNSRELEEKVKFLMMDDEVQKKSGIYYFIFDNDERWLNLRTFSDTQKREKYEEQNGLCVLCEEVYDIADMEGDHISPWSLGGKTTYDNLQMLCKNCNRTKSSR